MHDIPANSCFDSPSYRMRGNEDFCEKRADYVFTAFLATGVALLVLAALMESSLIPGGALGRQWCAGIGGGMFGLGGSMLLMRGCCSRCTKRELN